jgi:enoyl-CoA hydratase/carnithine racemase
MLRIHVSPSGESSDAGGERAATVLYEAEDGGVATLTLNRPERLNTIVPELIDDLLAGLRRAQADPEVRAIRLRAAGRMFCAGYDILWGSESMGEAEGEQPWDPIADYQGMTRFVDAYMELWRSPTPVIAQVHRFCVAGGTDLALCSDLVVCDEECRIGYPPARVWGSPTTSMWVYRLGLERAKRLLLTGDPIDGRTAVAWGLASEAVPLEALDEAGLALARRVARLPANQLHMMKLLVNQAYEQMGLRVTQLVGTLLDGTARHTPEGTDFTRRALEDVRRAVADRDAPFGDYGQGPATAGP